MLKRSVKIINYTKLHTMRVYACLGGGGGIRKKKKKRKK